MGAQKNRLNEKVLLSTQNICSTYGLKNIYNFALKNFVYLNLTQTNSKIWTSPLYILMWAPGSNWMVDSINPDLTAHFGTVWSGFTLFAQDLVNS